MTSIPFHRLRWFGKAPQLPEQPKWASYLSKTWNPALKKFRPHGLPLAKLAQCTRAREPFLRQADTIMAKLPAAVLAKLEGYGALVLPVYDIFDYVEWLPYSGPRGHQDRFSYAYLTGLCGHDGRVLVLCETYCRDGRRLLNDNAEGVFNHECGHCLDAACGYVSRSHEFLACVAEDIERLIEKIGTARMQAVFSYYLQVMPAGPSEIFAEGFASTMGKGCHSYRPDDFREAFPKSCQFIANLIASLPSPTVAYS